MRRIYDSSALRRDDEEPFSPRERDSDPQPEAMRSLPSGFLSRLLFPRWLRCRAVTVGVETRQVEYPSGVGIPFQVTMKNEWPIPVSVPTRSPIRWSWSVDGYTEAAQVPLQRPPEGDRRFEFDRGERKTFEKTWDQMFRVSRSEWEPVEPGEYTIGVGINTDGAGDLGLTDETTVRVV